jgi:(E)-4-hydroxy-3-methylbut-2-enyl-diphosphate synthase
MIIPRRKSRSVNVGGVRIGGNSPVSIQSMTKTETADTAATLRQIKGLEGAGCEIVRLAVKDVQDALAIKKIKQKTGIPLVADIHFDWRLAITALENGADKIRLNPGNIYKEKELLNIVAALKAHHKPLRVGVNSGSLRDTLARPASAAQKLIAGCLSYLRRLEKMKFYDMVVSLKGSNVRDTIEAYRELARRCDYPLHLGLTATGLPSQGLIKSSIALGALLLNGIGDTIRVSLTAEPQQEVRAARDILQALGLRCFGVEVISCPTCGRCQVPLVKIVNQLEKRVSALKCSPGVRPLKIALMGCVVNGPGEAKQADVGVAFGRGQGLLFKKGKPLKKISLSNCVDALLAEMAR